MSKTATRSRPAATRGRPAKKDWERRATEALASAGHRAGGARTAVVELLARQDCCLSAQQIHERLRSEDRSVGIASVYRALDALEELDLVGRLEVGDGGGRYEPLTPGGEHHHHVICDGCGEVTAFEDAPLEGAIDDLAARLSHMVSTHDVVIHGTCRRCAPATRR